MNHDKELQMTVKKIHIILITIILSGYITSCVSVFRQMKEKRDTNYRQGLALYKNKNYREAKKKFATVVSIDPDYKKARIYLTYKNINNDLAGLIEQTYAMNVKNHITKADAINEQVINDKEDNIYGVLYDLKGNTATSVQFYVTDSIKNYLRGSLYFESEPNADSLAPVISFFREDIIHLIETLKWKGK